MRTCLNAKFKYSLFFLTLIYSCGTRDRVIKQVDTTSASNQVVKQSNDDSVSDTDFLKFKSDFKRNPDGKIDETKLLPLPYIKKILGDDIDTSMDKVVTPIEFVRNANGYYFIIKERCGAGGDCASFGNRYNKKAYKIITSIVSFIQNSPFKG